MGAHSSAGSSGQVLEALLNSRAIQLKTDLDTKRSVFPWRSTEMGLQWLGWARAGESSLTSSRFFFFFMSIGFWSLGFWICLGFFIFRLFLLRHFVFRIFFCGFVFADLWADYLEESDDVFCLPASHLQGWWPQHLGRLLQDADLVFSFFQLCLRSLSL